MNRRLNEIGIDDVFVNLTRREIQQKDSIQRPLFMPYISAHIDYGKNMKNLLKLLENDQGKWQFQDNEVTFELTESSNAFNGYSLKMIEIETLINEYLDKLEEIE